MLEDLKRTIAPREKHGSPLCFDSHQPREKEVLVSLKHKIHSYCKKNPQLTYLALVYEGEDALYTNLSSSDLNFPKMTFMSLFYQNRYSALPRSSIFIIYLLIPLMVHEYMLYVPFVESKIVLRHPKRDASKNVSTLIVSENYEILHAS